MYRYRIFAAIILVSIIFSLEIEIMAVFLYVYLLNILVNFGVER